MPITSTIFSSATSYSDTHYYNCQLYITGAKNRGGHFGVNADIDEIKVFYRALSNRGTYSFTT